MTLIEQLTQLIVDESKWLSFSLMLAVIGAVTAVNRLKNVSRDQMINKSLNLLFGITIGAMAFGHILAVTVKIILGTLDASISIPLLYLLGFSLGIPSWWLAYVEFRGKHAPERRKIIGLNLWVAATLIILGLHNLPLALPGFINAARNVRSDMVPKNALMWTSLLIFAFLLVGSIIFMINGESFEEFSGIDN